MNWLIIALLSPALWAASSHIDKYLIEKYFKGRGVGALIIFSSIIGVFVLPFILLFEPKPFNISFAQLILIIFSSVISILAILIYLYALKKDEASIVVPLFQTIPIFAFILGYLFLGEILSHRQIAGGLLIILGGLGLSLDLKEKVPRLKSNIFFLMLLASLLIAISGLLFKVVAVEANFWTATFWAYAGEILMGAIFLVFIKSYRVEFWQVIQINKLAVLSLNAFNEVINVIATLIFRFVILLAPLALIWAINGLQPLFVFLFGVILTLFFPNLEKESLAKKNVIQKIFTILIMFLGTYFLYT